MVPSSLRSAQWLKNAGNLEFYDEETDEPNSKPQQTTMMLALAKSKFKTKIYHSPREGTWWSETPDVKGPAVIFGVNGRPNSAKFKSEKLAVYEPEPLIIIERGMADLLNEVDGAKARAKARLMSAKRGLKEKKKRTREPEDGDAGELSAPATKIGDIVRKIYDPLKIQSLQIKEKMTNHSHNHADIPPLKRKLKVKVKVKLKQKNQRPKSANPANKNPSQEAEALKHQNP